MKKSLYYPLHNIRRGKKKNQEKELKKNIDFKFVLQNYAIFYFAYISFVMALLSSSTTTEEVTSYNYLPVFFPLPLFILITAIFVEIDNRRTLINFELQDEIKRIKNMYAVRKKTEDIFDGKQ